MTKVKKSVPRATPREAEQLREIGVAFRNKRMDMRLSFGDVAKKSGVSNMTISNLEKGELENSTLSTLNKIAKVLKMEVAISVS